MAIDTLKNLEGTSRRRFLRWAGVAGAMLGLERANFLNVLSDSAGVAMADAASCAATMKSFHIVAGDGSAVSFADRGWL